MKTINAQGDVTIASDRIAVEQLDGGAWSGEPRRPARLQLAHGQSPGPARCPTARRATSISTRSRLSPRRRSATMASRCHRKRSLALDIGKATLAGVDAQAVNAHAQARRRQIADRPPLHRQPGRGEARCQRKDRRIVVAAARADHARSRRARARRLWATLRPSSRRAPPKRCATRPIAWCRQKCMPPSSCSGRRRPAAPPNSRSTATWRPCASRPRAS